MNTPSANSDFEQLQAHVQQLALALEEFVIQAKSWHKSTGHGEEGACVQCDAICAAIPAGEAALKLVACSCGHILHDERGVCDQCDCGTSWASAAHGQIVPAKVSISTSRKEN